MLEDKQETGGDKYFGDIRGWENGQQLYEMVEEI
jgi:hypothetical protein